jgi:hypothetical protein
MFGFKVTIQNDTNRVLRKYETAAFRTFNQAAFAIRRSAVESIEKAEGPSDPGSPPHTHNRMFLRRAIRYEANKEGAVIGPRYSAVGISGEPHEFGGKYKGDVYPARPFMRPALEANLSRFASSWSGSISE